MSEPQVITLHPHQSDLYEWQAVYEDGTGLREIEGDRLHTWKDIDHARVVAFYLWPLSPGLPQYGIELRPGERLIFLRRISHHLQPEVVDAAGGQSQLVIRDTGRTYTWHVLGFQRTVGETNVAVYQFISEEGLCFLSTDFQANERIDITARP